MVFIVILFSLLYKIEKTRLSITNLELVKKTTVVLTSKRTSAFNENKLYNFYF